MKEKINLVNILKDCPKGTPLYTTYGGDCTLVNVRDNPTNKASFQISVMTHDGKIRAFTKNGTLDYDYDELALFPSKEQRDWSKFIIPKKQNVMTDTIKNFSFNQHKIIYDIINLHNNGQPFDCDMTYSSGNFYGDFTYEDNNKQKIPFTIEQPKYKFDVAPQSEDITKIEPEGNLPLDDSSIHSIMIDLPFCIAPPNAKSMLLENHQKGRNIILKRFASYYPVSNLIDSYKHWIEEAYRVLDDNGICAFKCQNTITGSKFLPTEELSWLFAELTSFEILDKFVLGAKQRIISGKIRQQQHARNYISVFYVFRKSRKKAIKYLAHLDNEHLKQITDSLVNHWTNI